MKKMIVLSFFTLIGLTFTACTATQPAAEEKSACCPGYESVAQPDKCVKKNCMAEEIIQPNVSAPIIKEDTLVLERDNTLLISVIGQGVAPMNTASPAQAYALAKRAAVADSYRLIAEKVKGVYVDGQDLVQNMMIKRSTVRTSVNATVRNATVVETTFKEGLCEVEMEITINYSQFAR